MTANLPFEAIDYDAAHAKAIAENRYLVVDTTATWCAPCRTMERSTWPAAAVREWLAVHAVCIRVDTDAEPALAKKLSIASMPTVILFRNGRELDRISGMRGPADLVAWLEGVRAGRTELDVLREAVDANPHDVSARYNLAQKHLRADRRGEALAELLWLWEHVLEHAPEMLGVRSSYMLGDIGRLIAVHPPARDAFCTLRDRREEELSADEGSAADFIDLCIALRDEDRILRWLDGPGAELLQRDRPPGAVVVRLSRVLARRGRWGDLCRLYNDPVVRLRERYDRMNGALAGELPPDLDVDEMREATFSTLRTDAAAMHRAFRMAGHSEEADAIAAEMRRLLPGDATEQALARSASNE